MGAEKRRRFQPDPRTWLLLCLLGIAAILVIRSEIGCLCLFLACLLIHMLAGNGGKILPYGLYYLIFYGIGWLGVHLMDSGVAFSVSSMLSSIGIVSRKVLVPLSFVICLAGEPTGSLMAALQKLHLPKAAGIGTAVVLRFFPTIAGEYRAIRSSQRFRGIGVGVLHTLTHLPTTVEYILIPLILRTTKVAEELSASMTVRGVRFSGETVSYRSIRFCWKDAALLALLLAVACTVLLLERGGVALIAGGTGNPFFTTDSGAALRALEIRADALLKGTRVDGVYTADPEKDPDAVKYDELTFDKALENHLKVMDQTAFALCREGNMPIVVFDMNREGNLMALLKGEKVGTVVHL